MNCWIIPVIASELDGFVVDKGVIPSPQQSVVELEDHYSKSFGNLIIDGHILSSVFKLLSCQECQSTELNLSFVKKFGLAVQLKIHCTSCGWKAFILDIFETQKCEKF